MQIIAFNVRIPEDGDAGNVWSNALEHNWENVFVPHTHDGVNSELLTISSIVRPTTTLDSAAWEADADNRGYKQAVTAPAGTSLDKIAMRFRVKSGSLIHTFIHPRVKPLSLTAFEVYVNDPTLELEILYI